ncbi:hypothetical protein [Jeotgalicoccus psychrophilus]|uniref:hypothetical protein n=1 Tax=Jeotgalicoccus psychrophilus TaxID=157228 RepID=UPI0004247676|nr:hypothetical protein [Jeotgalicoccus psychrophilus]
MKGFLYIFQKKNINHDSKNIIKYINNLKQTEHHFNYNENAKLKCYLYTNESELSKESTKSSKNISLIGQFVDDIDKITNKLFNLEEEKLRKYVSELKGAFALALADFSKNEMKFFTHIFRIDNIFYRETPDQIVIGTDPLIVSALSNAERYEPEIEIKNSVSFLMNGYFADENTLFKGIKVVPPNSEMTINNNGVALHNVDNSIEEISTIKPSSEFNNLLKQNYIDAFKAVPKNNKINIGITGGKDSRLALLGLLEAGYKVNTNTRGFLDNPDVKVAEMIASKLRLKHKITEPKIMDAKGLTVNLEKKALGAMVATSGQVYGYENISYQPSFKGNIGVTGVAALSMKGGYSNLNNLKPDNPKAEMVKRFLPLDNLLVEGVSKEYKHFLESLVTSDFQNAQYKHALFYRNGRWTSGTRLAKAYSSDIYSPYYDNHFSKSIMKVKKDYLDNGFTQYTLTNKLNEEISKLPIVGSRWGFEKEQPMRPENYSSWLSRAPLYPMTKMANYNWRNLTLKENDIVRNKFKEILLSDPNHVIYQVINYEELKNTFEKGLSNKYLKFMWAALSLFSYINYIEGQKISAENINIKIPQTVINEVNIVPTTSDLMPEINTINNGLTLSNYNNKYTVSVNNEVNKNRYLTTFSKNISKGTENEKANIKDRKKISFNMFIESRKTINFRYCVIFFKDNNKIETKWFKSAINDVKSNLKGTVSVPLDANNYKVAIKVPNEIDEAFEIKYFFAKTE